MDQGRDRVLAGAGRGILPLPALPHVGQPSPHRGPFRAVARPDPGLRPHHLARPRRVLRIGRVHRGAPRTTWLWRAAFRAGPRGRDRRGGGLDHELPDRARAGPHAPDGDPRHRAHALRDCEPGLVDHRRRRRAFRRRNEEDLRHLRLRPRWQDRLSLHPRRPLPRIQRSAPSRTLAVRVEPEGYPRRRAADAGDRRLGQAQTRHRVHRRRGHRRLRFSALGRADDHARPRRHWLFVRGPARCGGLHASAGLSRQSEPRLLAILAGDAPRAAGALRARRVDGRSLDAAPAMGAQNHAMSVALRTQSLSKAFGAFMANSDVSLSFEAGARHALIGPNGAGKTTFINLLTGFLAPTSGEVYLGEERITALPQHVRVKRGMTRTFQINTLFPGLTALESVVLACSEREGHGGVWWRTVSAERVAIDEARQILAQLKLDRDADVPTRALPYGKQRLLEIALALATRPTVLLLDEPGAGIPSAESAELFNVIANLPREVTIVFIEHDMKLVFRFAERITVLVGGSVLVEGAPEEIARDPRVREVYLGEAQHD